MNEYAKLSTYSTLVSKGLTMDDISRYVSQVEMNRHRCPERPYCHCYACIRDHMHQLRRCGCGECYHGFRYFERKLEYIEYREQHVEVRYTYGIDMGTKQLNEPTKEKDMNIVEKVKNLKLSAGDKLLRKHGIVDAEGDLTSTGQSLIWGRLLEQFKDELVADLKAVEKTEKECKK